jgi:hypothetical protein
VKQIAWSKRKRAVCRLMALLCGLSLFEAHNAMSAPRLEVPANFNPRGALGVQNVQFQLELHVDGANPASVDSNSGTARQPFKTMTRGIKAAFEAQAAGKSVRLCVHPGTYREEYDEPFRWGTLNDVKPFSPNEPRVLIEATQPHSVVMTGADVFSDWKPSENGFLLTSGRATCALLCKPKPIGRGITRCLAGLKA